jgi:hypothetical protein
MGSSIQLEIILQECSKVEQLPVILRENSRLPLNIILVFHDASDASFATCLEFYKIVQERRRDSRVLWIGNMDQSFEANNSRKDRIEQVVGEPAPRFLQTSLVEPDHNLQVIIRSFFCEIMKNNQLATNKRVLEELSATCPDPNTLEVSDEHFQSTLVWMGDSRNVKNDTRYSSPFDVWEITSALQQV